MARKNRKSLMEVLATNVSGTAKNMADSTVGISKNLSKSASAMLPKGRK